MDTATRILAVETSGRHGSVATLYGDEREARLIGQVVLSGEQRTAQSLAPAIKELLTSAEWEPKSIGLVAVTIGPGSFTGLRIGVTTAKTIAYAVNAEVLGVNTLDVLAAQAPPSAAPLWTILDAQRQELFAARFAIGEGGNLIITVNSTIISQPAWLSALRSGDRVIGPALTRLVDQLPNGVVALPQENWQPMAATIGRVAWQQFQAGRRDDLWKLTPQYYRPSAAEEKLK